MSPWSGSGSASPFQAQQARKVKLICLSWLLRNRSTQLCDRQREMERETAHDHTSAHTQCCDARPARPNIVLTPLVSVLCPGLKSSLASIHPYSSKVPPTFSAAGGRLHRCKQPGSVENAPLLSELCRGKARWDQALFRLPRFWWGGCLRPLRPFFFSSFQYVKRRV